MLSAENSHEITYAARLNRQKKEKQSYLQLINGSLIIMSLSSSSESGKESKDDYK